MNNYNQNNQYSYPNPQHMPPPPPPLIHHDNQFFGHHMPYNGPMPGNVHPPHAALPGGPPGQLPIIADALHVAYADYRGDFNLDEAAYYTANQWNNMKEAMNNRNY